MIDHVKSAETRKAKKAEKEAVGLSLNWTRKQAILAWCHQCMNNQPAEVRRCNDTTCPLWPFRCRKGVAAAEMKEWETDFKSSADGQRFLKDRVDDSEEEAAAASPVDGFDF